MTVPTNYREMSLRELRLDLEALYADYIACLDEERFEEWPEFFVEDCLYKIVPRENDERGLPLATWRCESKGYLHDRVTAIRRTAIYAPRLIRRMVSGIRIIGWTQDTLEVRANFASFETLTDELTRVFIVGQYRDRIAIVGDRLKFQEKICVFDSMLIPNSLIYPL
jgi:3-phenylpropionate/cinnamic acid dioxygenase small subunit